jgi:predicted nucleic acid-binding protein
VARDYLIDTNLPRQPSPRLLFSRMSLGEIEYGYQLGGSVVDRRHDFTLFLEACGLALLGIEPGTATEYGRVRAALFNKYAPKKDRRGLRPEQLKDQLTSQVLGIQENDLWIVAQALAHDLTLVTNDDMSHIRNVTPELVVANWAVGTGH